MNPQVTTLLDKARECRKQAGKALSSTDKDAWLRLSAEWINLAQMAEEKKI
jgi:hypothetical protein